jgi:hypothetical protein
MKPRRSGFAVDVSEADGTLYPVGHPYWQGEIPGLCGSNGAEQPAASTLWDVMTVGFGNVA